MKDAIRTTLADLADLLNERDLPFAVIGGIAVMVRGEPRFTADVDLVVDSDIDCALRLLETLDGTPFQPLFPDASDVVRTSFILPLRHVTTGVTADLAIGQSGFERQLIARATMADFGDCPLPVASAEDLILLKLIAARPRDTDDAYSIVDRQGESLDWEYLLATGGELQRSLSQDLVPQLERLRRRGVGPDTEAGRGQM